METAVVTIDAGAEALAKKTEWIAKRDQLIIQAAAVPCVTNAEELERAGKLQTAISKAIKELESARMELTRQLDNRKKEIMAQERDMVGALESELARIKSMNSDYATAQAAKVEEARRKAELEARIAAEAEFKRQQEEEAARLAAEEKAFADQQKASALFGSAVTVKPVEPAPVPVAPPPPPPKPVFIPPAPKTSANKFTEVWKFEVVDPNAVPREFCTVDESVIRKWLAFQKSLGQDIATLKVNGLRLYKEMQVGSR
jgi:hypothetical protein